MIIYIPLRLMNYSASILTWARIKTSIERLPFIIIYYAAYFQNTLAFGKRIKRHFKYIIWSLAMPGQHEIDLKKCYIFLSLLLNHLSDRSILIDSKCRSGSQSGRSLNSSWPTFTLHQNLVMWTVKYKLGVDEQNSNMENIRYKCIAGCNEILVITGDNNWNSTVLTVLQF